MVNKSKPKRNIYTHEIDLTPLTIKNQERDKFRKELERIKYRGYEVEQLSDGRKIVITKPGGKFVFGTIKRDDFMVWIFQPGDNSLWLISHKNILDDLEEKGKISPADTIQIIDALERVFHGEDPDDILQQVRLKNPCKEAPEVLMKAYKWIWGQEDCNYPPPLQGRDMSIKAILGLRSELRKCIKV
jgi:hypothetical protein